MVTDVAPAGHQVVFLLEILHDSVHVTVVPSLRWELRHRLTVEPRAHFLFQPTSFIRYSPLPTIVLIVLRTSTELSHRRPLEASRSRLSYLDGHWSRESHARFHVSSSIDAFGLARKRLLMVISEDYVI